MTNTEKFKIGLQYWLPKQLLTRLVGWLASKDLGVVTTFVIRRFISAYGINMMEAKQSDPTHFATFNDFFIRELKEEARSIAGDEKVIVHPADARVSQFGSITNDALIQAKGQTYTTAELLAGDEELAKLFTDGHFATLYLSPSDYHRVHMPCDGELREMIYVPGELFSVNPLTAENVPGLFARNERLICVFNTAFGPMVQILVGATIVGSIATTWAGTVTPPRGKSIYRSDYKEGNIVFKKGEEMGHFKLGSTVINLFPKNSVEFDESMMTSAKTVLGTAYAHVKS